MKRTLRFVLPYLRDGIVGIVFFPPICWLIYQGMKDTTPWYTITSICVLGLLVGITAIGAYKYVDAKIEKASGAKNKW